jgi:hypothetical protein
MTSSHEAAGHHDSAAFHHDQAARYHLQASRHFEVGKDYAHTAHKALVAHVHGLQAAERGFEASRSYTRQNGGDSSWSSELPSQASDGKLEEVTKPARGGKLHHEAAAEHHEQAKVHHHRAREKIGEEDLAGAAQESEIAESHARQAIFHDDEAAKHYVEHYSESGPSAELS